MNLPSAVAAPTVAFSARMLAMFEEDFMRWSAEASSGPHTPELERQLERALLEPARAVLALPGKLFRARLVQSAYALAGGEPGGLPEELPLVVEVLHAGSLIVDDVQDRSQRRRGAPALHRVVGEPLAINTGNLFYCWALDRLGRAELRPERVLELQRRTLAAMLRCHQGQALDLSTRAFELGPHELPALVRSSTELKAGSLMELAAALGAVAADCEPTRSEALCEFGRGLGLGLQMLDDLSGLTSPARRQKAREDLRLARPTWVWAWLAHVVDGQELARLQQAARAVHEGASPDALIDELGPRLARRGRLQVHRHLRAILDALAESVGLSGELVALRQEIERLEASYG